MTQLDDHIREAEKYGFVRWHFPMDYNGHRLQILSNDAFIDDGRLMFAFCLHCKHCKRMDRISGRFPADCDRQKEYVVNAKLAVFDKFNAEQCQGK